MDYTCYNVLNTQRNISYCAIQQLHHRCNDVIPVVTIYYSVVYCILYTTLVIIHIYIYNPSVYDKFIKYSIIHSSRKVNNNEHIVTKS